MKSAVPVSTASLRTKTGCLACRLKRKKCDERHPLCTSCIKSGRSCEWPDAEDLIDGRHRSSRQRRRKSSSQDTVADDIPALRPTVEAAIATKVIGVHQELVVGRHFVDTYYSTLINPECHRDFYDDWISDIQTFMSDSPGLRYSVLANGASNLYLKGKPGQMQELALSYYSRSLRGLTQAVSDAAAKDEDHPNAILMNVILLYLHGCMGHGTYIDIPLHVNAAIQIVTWRFLNADPPMKLTRLFDRLAVESVIYQIYLLQMGLWSKRKGEGLDFDFDPQFWLRCEALLARSVMFPGQPVTRNSPVLGMPFALFKIMLIIRALWEENRAGPCFKESLRHLRDELQPWEVWLHETCGHRDRTFAAERTTSADAQPESLTDDAVSLTILAALLLTAQLEDPCGTIVPGSPPVTSWERPMMVDILRRRCRDPQWEMSCVALFPVYVAGHFMTTQDEIVLVRNEMRGRADRMSWSQVNRLWDDLETRWAQDDHDV